MREQPWLSGLNTRLVTSKPWVQIRCVREREREGLESGDFHA